MNKVLYEVRDGVAVLTVNRPEALNALDLETHAAIKEAALRAEGAREVAGILLTGAGEKAFVAGADIKELAAARSADDLERLSLFGQDVFATLAALKKPVLAAVNGFALGGGLELAMACHDRVLCENALLGQPEVNLGIIPGYGGTQRLPRLVGFERAWSMLRTGRPIKAAEGAAAGLGTLLPREGFLDAAKTRLKVMIDHRPRRLEPAPLPVPEMPPELELGHLSRSIDALLQAAILEGLRLPLEQGLRLEARYFGACHETEDLHLGLRNFLEQGPRHPAPFVHR